MQHAIVTLKNYPDNGKHQRCETIYPFDISKGMDGFYYNNSKGEEQKYNMFVSEKIDERWIAFVEKKASPSLKKIFKTKLHKDLNVILEYCDKLYIRSLKMEIKRLRKELKEFTKQ